MLLNRELASRAICLVSAFLDIVNDCVQDEKSYYDFPNVSLVLEYSWQTPW